MHDDGEFWMRILAKVAVENDALAYGDQIVVNGKCDRLSSDGETEAKPDGPLTTGLAPKGPQLRRIIHAQVFHQSS